MIAIKPGTKALIVNAAMITGLALEYWRGAPWLAIVITAGIALPLANTLMLLKSRRMHASKERPR